MKPPRGDDDPDSTKRKCPGNMMQYYKDAMEVLKTILTFFVLIVLVHDYCWTRSQDSQFSASDTTTTTTTEEKKNNDHCVISIIIVTISSSCPSTAPRARPHAPARQLHHDRQQPGHRDQSVQLSN